MEQLMSKKNVRGDGMQGTQRLHDAGQSLWLDNITRDLLNNGTLKRYIDELSITGLTSNPTIFDHAIKNSTAYDAAISQKAGQTSSAEELFFELALEDLSRAAELFRPIHEKTNGVDGWVSLEVSPLLAHDTARTLAAAKELFERANLPNLLIKIPGTKEGLPAIEEAIFSGVPINVTLLFSREQYLAAAEAYLRGIERRVAAGLNPDVASVASVFISRWDVAVANKVSAGLREQLGIAIAKRTYAAANVLLSSQRSRRLYNFGARPQRLLWASTGMKNPAASRDSVRQSAGSTFHREYHAGRDAESSRRSFRVRRVVIHRWRQQRRDPGRVCEGRSRCRCFGSPTSERGSKIFCELVERSDGGDLFQEPFYCEELSSKEHKMATPLRVSNRTQSKASARAALQSHYKSISTLHLRQLFADDPQRGERMAAEAAGIYLDYSKHRITDRDAPFAFSVGRGTGPAIENRRDVRRRKDQHHGGSCGLACGATRSERMHPLSWMARMSCLRFTPSSTRWLISQTACGPARGAATQGSAFATSSTSGLAAPILGLSWHMRRSNITVSER